MKELKVAKYQVLSSIKPIIVFYIIVILVMNFFVVTSVSSSDQTIRTSGLDFASFIFLFVCGLNAFKETFYLTQANNISRKTFFKGLILGVFPITIAMAIIDIIINRVQNIFAKCPTTFDMIYGALRNIEFFSEWTQSNDFLTLFGTLIWQFSTYSFIYILGILISLSYYRSNKIVKILISFIPIFIFIFFISANSTFNGGINIEEVISVTFGIQSQNPYIAFLTLSILMVIFSTSIYLLTKRAVTKD